MWIRVLIIVTMPAWIIPALWYAVASWAWGVLDDAVWDYEYKKHLKEMEKEDR